MSSRRSASARRSARRSAPASASASVAVPARARGRLALAAALLVVLALPGCAAASASAADRAEPANASGGELIAEQACYDVEHYTLRLAVDPAEESIDGSLVMRARVTQPTTRIALDLDERLDVDGVRVNGEEVRTTHEDGRLWIALGRPRDVGETLRVEVAYGGTPRVAPRPPWDGGFTWATTPEGGEPWITTTCQGEGADLWWPCKDHPSDKPDGVELFITVPDGLVCASNGTLRGTAAHDDGTRTFHWVVDDPISNYGVALNIGPYELLEARHLSTSGDEIAVAFYHLPESRERAAAILPQFVDHLAHMESVCGPYPFRGAKYGVVETPHLGMEHQTIIAYGNRFRPGTHGDAYDWLHHHELSHEWWGNLVTCSDWRDMWIHEGIGTYMQALYLEQRFGPDAYRAEMRAKRRQLVNERAVAPRTVHDSRQIYFRPDGRFDNDIYSKGSWVVHSLRWLLGDETFFAVLRRWAYPTPEHERATDGSQVRLVDTDELLAIAEATSGQELDWFFEVYLRQPVLPRLSGEQDEGVLSVRWEVPDGLPFPMPVPVEIDGDLVRVPVGGNGVGAFALGRNATWVLDPGDLVLKELAEDDG